MIGGDEDERSRNRRIYRSELRPVAKTELRVKKERQMSKTVDGRRLLIAQKTLMVIKSLMNLHDAEVKKILLAALETVETE